MYFMVHYLIFTHFSEPRSLTLLVLVVPSQDVEQSSHFHICEFLQVLLCPLTRWERLVGCDRSPATVVGGTRDERLNRGRKEGRVRGLRSDESRVSDGREREGRSREGRSRGDNRVSNGRGGGDRVVGASGSTLSI